MTEPTSTHTTALPPLRPAPVFPPCPGGLGVTNAHPRDAHIEFFDENHIYVVDGRDDFVSCTTFVHSFARSFDADKVVANMVRNDATTRGMLFRDLAAPPEEVAPDYRMRKGKYAGMTASEIKALWQHNGELASQAGTIIHAFIEYYYNGWTVPDTIAVPPEFSTHFEPFHREVVETRGMVPYRSEWCVYDEDHELAGSIDMVYQEDAANPDRVLIYDWKRSLKLRQRTSSQKMLSPLEHLPDVSYWHYALQLNVYRHILETRYGKTVVGLFLVCVHPSEETFQEVKVPMLHEETAAVFARRKAALEEAQQDAKQEGAVTAQ